MVSSDFCNKTKKEKGTLSNWAHESIEGQRVGLMMIFKSSSPSRNCPTASIFFSLSSSRLLKIKESAIQIVQFDTKRHYIYSISIDLKWYYYLKIIQGYRKKQKVKLWISCKSSRSVKYCFAKVVLCFGLESSGFKIDTPWHEISCRQLHPVVSPFAFSLC